jgi:serine/threonine-protein kinase HipA
VPGRNQAAVLGIFLSTAKDSDLRVGSLIRDSGGAVSFLVDEDYIALGPNRPIISMAWRGADEQQTIQRLIARTDKTMRGGLLPPFFQNLLPEGALRELVDKEFGSGPFDEFDVLARLGHDLPGAIIARLEAGEAGKAEDAIALNRKPETSDQPSKPKIRFSLAGVQLKFSMTKRGAITMPAKGGAGDLILKTPSKNYSNLPELEFSSLKLASAAGVRTVEAWLVEADQIEGIPKEFLGNGQKSLAVRRFDRAPGDRRIHIEDFAQIVGAIGDRKYTMANIETMLNIVRRFTADWRGHLLEGVRRVVVDLMIGNGDAHLKNWSFIYRDGLHAELSPAYDIVPTFIYGDGTLAVQFGGTRNPLLITLHRFERAAGLLKVDPNLITKEVRLMVEKILDVWPREMKNLPLPLEDRTAIANRWQQMALVGEVRPEMAQGFRLPPQGQGESGHGTEGNSTSNAPRKLSSG